SSAHDSMRPCLLFLGLPPPPRSTLFPYTTLFRSQSDRSARRGTSGVAPAGQGSAEGRLGRALVDRAHRLLPALLRRRRAQWIVRSEEHTSELQSLRHLVCRLLLEKKKQLSTLTST